MSFYTEFLYTVCPYIHRGVSHCYGSLRKYYRCLKQLLFIHNWVIIGVLLNHMVHFIFEKIWQPCNSSATNIHRWNKQKVVQVGCQLGMKVLKMWKSFLQSPKNLFENMLKTMFWRNGSNLPVINFSYYIFRSKEIS